MSTDIRTRAERLARLLEEQAEIAAQISELKAEAKADGYDPSLLMKTARLMNMDAEKRRKQLDQHELFDTYLSAVGLVAERVEPETPDRMEPQYSPSAHGGTDVEHGETARGVAQAARQTVGGSAVASAAGSSTAEVSQAATPIPRDEYPEMPAFLRRTRPVATEITA
jgi:uncharacterized protein (UPF0335 family)